MTLKGNVQNMTVKDFIEALRYEYLVHCVGDEVNKDEAKRMYNTANELLVDVMFYKEKNYVQDNHANAEGDRTDETGDTEDLPFH